MNGLDYLYKAEAPEAPVAPVVEPAQIMREEYPFVGFVDFQGIPIDIENVAGSVRSGCDSEGTPWETMMRAHYGEIRGSDGEDGDPIDVFVGPDGTADVVVIVNQQDPTTQKFDEHKVMLGFRSAGEALEMYLAHYNRPDFYASHVETDVAGLKDWVAGRDVGPAREAAGGELARSDQLRVRLLQAFGADFQGFDSDGEPVVVIMRKARRAAPGQMSLFSAGPFVGPRGGLWADPQHTTHWDPNADKPAPVAEAPEHKPVAPAAPEEKPTLLFTPLQVGQRLRNKHGAEVEVVRVGGGQGQIRGADGKAITVPLSVLNSWDRVGEAPAGARAMPEATLGRVQGAVRRAQQTAAALVEARDRDIAGGTPGLHEFEAWQEHGVRAQIERLGDELATLDKDAVAYGQNATTLLREMGELPELKLSAAGEERALALRKDIIEGRAPVVVEGKPVTLSEDGRRYMKHLADSNRLTLRAAEAGELAGLGFVEPVDPTEKEDGSFGRIHQLTALGAQYAPARQAALADLFSTPDGRDTYLAKQAIAAAKTPEAKASAERTLANLEERRGVVAPSTAEGVRRKLNLPDGWTVETEAGGKPRVIYPTRISGFDGRIVVRFTTDGVEAFPQSWSPGNWANNYTRVYKNDRKNPMTWPETLAYLSKRSESSARQSEAQERAIVAQTERAERMEMAAAETVRDASAAGAAHGLQFAVRRVGDQIGIAMSEEGDVKVTGDTYANRALLKEYSAHWDGKGWLMGMPDVKRLTAALRTKAAAPAPPADVTPTKIRGIEGKLSEEHVNGHNFYRKLMTERMTGDRIMMGGNGFRFRGPDAREVEAARDVQRLATGKLLALGATPSAPKQRGGKAKFWSGVYHSAGQRLEELGSDTGTDTRAYETAAAMGGARMGGSRAKDWQEFSEEASSKNLPPEVASAAHAIAWGLDAGRFPPAAADHVRKLLGDSRVNFLAQVIADAGDTKTTTEYVGRAISHALELDT